jgi:hypothetical protein
VGLNADKCEFGDYSGEPVTAPVSVLDGIKAAAGKSARVTHVPWDSPIEDALAAARSSQVVVAVMGINKDIEREGKDRNDLNLPADQQEYIQKLYRANPNLVLVLVAGSPLSIVWEDKNVIYAGESSKLASAEKILANFLAGNTLLLAATFSATKSCIDLDGELACLPYPKYDETQADYGTALNESNTLFGILVTTPDKNATAAVLEALASEGNRIVTPALYEVTLKTRYATDPAFAKMLDFIHDRVIFNFGSIYGYDMNQINTRYKGWVGAATMTWMSSYESFKDAAQKAIDDFCDKVNKLEQ